MMEGGKEPEYSFIYKYKYKYKIQKNYFINFHTVHFFLEFSRHQIHTIIYREKKFVLCAFCLLRLVKKSVISSDG